MEKIIVEKKSRTKKFEKFEKKSEKMSKKKSEKIICPPHIIHII